MFLVKFKAHNRKLNCLTQRLTNMTKSTLLYKNTYRLSKNAENRLSFYSNENCNLFGMSPTTLPTLGKINFFATHTYVNSTRTDLMKMPLTKVHFCKVHKKSRQRFQDLFESSIQNENIDDVKPIVFQRRYLILRKVAYLIPKESSLTRGLFIYSGRSTI